MTKLGKITARLAGSVAITALGATLALAQDTIELKFTTASVPSDIHTQAMQVFKDTLNDAAPDRFDVQLYDSGKLFAQGADLDALQRGNAELAYVSFQQIADAIPEYGLFTAGYLFQNPQHLRAVMESEIGTEVKKRVAEDMGLHILDICYLGTRQLNLRDVREVNTPADMDGVKLRMPGSDAWLFLGKALGAQPTPVPFSEVYLALQTGTIDGQDNPLPTVEAAKFYEVTKQITLTSHLVDGVNIMVNDQTWEQLSDDEKTAMQDAAVAACDWNNDKRISEEARLVEFFESEGLTVTTPDVDAFRSHVQDYYMTSDRAKDWPEGWVDLINALAP
ncbi:sialic acid TRAP transporter substrate-binding protein SiaP [Oceaniglobus indicus]|uniref:sialic acid TRAP transporter substrate-binding protein SiaP n=1 Tax=Oceaniglobus indicus TaxID=2047749 RepID=UPI000C1A4187|nr:sialic acid TRAP transporter substrate-binding protein SiaP [Oceaniglobus indicus]